MRLWSNISEELFFWNFIFAKSFQLLFIIDPQILVEISVEISDINRFGIKSKHPHISVFCELAPNPGYFFQKNDMTLLSLKAEWPKMKPQQLQHICKINFKKLLSCGKTAQKIPKITIMRKSHKISKIWRMASTQNKRQVGFCIPFEGTWSHFWSTRTTFIVQTPSMQQISHYVVKYISTVKIPL